ncbi:MAG: 2-dehydropantoate 2-reductase [Gammaproteobacteria bacterium]|nr:2-dehydropantoate 2-reductase [Gammaproteobacteria bacterium]
MRIAMMGSGGVGGYFGGRLAASGCDVTFIARGRHLEAIRERGLHIDSRDMGDATIHPAQATDDPAEIGEVDYVIIGVKLWDTAAAGEAILPMLGPETTVLSLQNGVDCDDVLAPIIGEQRLIGGVAFIASSVGAPGVIKHIGTMQRVVIGERSGGSSARVAALHAAMAGAGITAEISDDIERTIWEKFVFLIGLSATTTLMRTTLGPIREDPDRREILLEAMRETVAVGRAKGVDLPADYADNRLAFADGLPVDMTSSMHHDLENGNPLEVGWLSGAVARFGKAFGVPTPVNHTVYAALKTQAAPGP